MKTTIKDYFTFSKRDRKGIFWLLFILLSLIIFRLSRHWFPPSQHDYSEEIAALIEELESRRDSITQLQRGSQPPVSHVPANEKKIESSSSSSSSLAKPELFYFNPNLLERNGWSKLGFSERQVDVIFNFKKNGGVFYQKEDLARLYCLDDEKYDELEPWIKLEVSRESVLNLNSADTSELKALKGIGSYYANKIVDHRAELGGYHSFDQLLEIWKMRPETVKMLVENCVLDSTSVKRIPINSVDQEKLKRHPYFDWNLANAVVSYRVQHGRFNSWSDLRRIKLFDEETELKLKPYIGFDD